MDNKIVTNFGSLFNLKNQNKFDLKAKGYIIYGKIKNTCTFQTKQFFLTT